MITERRTGAVGTPPSSNRVAELLRHDAWPRDQLLRHQREQLQSVLSHAVASSPYYREVLGGDALAADVRLQELPKLSKATLMDQFDRVLADPQLRLDSLEEHAAGANPGALLAGAYHVFTTSGTTGRRGVFPQTRREFDQWVAAGWRMLARIGLDPQARKVGIAAPTPLHITHKLFSALGAFGGTRPRLTVSTPLPELVAALQNDRPQAILTAPSLAGMLAVEQLAGRMDIAPRRVVLAGEVLTDDVRQRVFAAWGVHPFQVYASTEALMLSSESADRVGLHISEDLVVLEAVDEADRPVAPGAPGYKVDHQPRQPDPAVDPLRARRHRHDRAGR